MYYAPVPLTFMYAEDIEYQNLGHHKVVCCGQNRK